MDGVAGGDGIVREHRPSHARRASRRERPSGHSHSGNEMSAGSRMDGVAGGDGIVREHRPSHARRASRRETRSDHSHSMVPGGFDVMSKTTRLTSRSSLIIREAICSSRSYGSRAQSAVIASSLVTARITTT